MTKWARSSLKVKVRVYNHVRKNVAEVVGVNLSDGFLVLIEIVK